ncbi:hypothetical protein DOY81_007756 [Sarcophaga bullata]|nr:hypothetical protein DOY81_007756 [Sarcophaga bullata]
MSAVAAVFNICFGYQAPINITTKKRKTDTNSESSWEKQKLNKILFNKIYFFHEKNF